ncbi:protein of unknown function [Candidatus Methylomirabilis oxygeniifera]|uniref:Uncharacterized protein n=1 Tax=Methylomirabilis oxygeniifera TaxID=671143 RepID=D5MJE7_METO1|nr:protein of unknown function [Candidatus Methylomirabilis oxyfera]
MLLNKIALWKPCSKKMLAYVAIETPVKSFLPSEPCSNLDHIDTCIRAILKTTLRL